MREQPPGCAFLVRHQILVAQVQNAPRQGRTPQRHQPVKAHIVPGDVHQVVAVVVVARGNREEIAEVRQHRVERMPPQTHDPRRWQRPRNETGVVEITRKLIGEPPRLARAGMGAGAREIVASDRAEVSLRCRRLHRLGIEHGPALRSRRPLDRQRHGLQFARAPHLGVRGEDAVDECGAGARHPDHEDRRILRRAAHRQCCHARPGPLDRFEIRGIARECIRQPRPVPGIGRRQPRESLLLAPDVLKLLGQRIAQQQPRIALPRARQRRLQPCDMVALRGHLAQP
jgi:hypothetical protein